MPARNKSVYVVELSPNVLDEAAFLEANPHYTPGDESRECLYVGRTGLTPEERFDRHLRGVQAGRRKFVMNYGLRLRPDLYEHLNPMTYEEVEITERTLAEELRGEGYAVYQK